MKAVIVCLCVCMAVPAALAGLPDTIAQLKSSVLAVATYNKLATPALTIRGTGFVVGDGLLAVTNSHVVPETLAENEHLLIIAGHGNERQQREAVLLRRDPAHDLALLRLLGAPLPAMRLAAATPVRDGSDVAISGFPIGGVMGLSLVTHRGIVSALTPIVLPGGHAKELNPAAIRRIRAGSFDVYQLDITAYPGSSGSPMYDIDSGEVLGIVNSVYVKGSKEAALSNPTGITFAIPVRYLHELINAR